MNTRVMVYPILFSVGPIHLESTQANITQAEIIIIRTTFIQSTPSHGKIPITEIVLIVDSVLIASILLLDLILLLNIYRLKKKTNPKPKP